MKRKGLTIFLIVLMVGGGIWYGYDLYSNFDFASGLFKSGVVWYRYALMLAIALLAVAGVVGVGPYAVGVMRLRHPVLATFFLACGIYGFLMGSYGIVLSVQPLQPLQLVFACFVFVFGVWMVLAAKQLAWQKKPTPTKGAFFGMMAALPLCLLAGGRAMSNPATLHRPLPLINVMSALVAMLWMGTLLHAMYVATVRRRAKVLYVLGLQMFFTGTCLNGAQIIVLLLNGRFSGWEAMQSLLLMLLGLVAGGFSLALVSGEPKAEWDIALEEGVEDLPASGLEKGREEESFRQVYRAFPKEDMEEYPSHCKSLENDLEE